MDSYIYEPEHIKEIKDWYNEELERGSRIKAIKIKKCADKMEKRNIQKQIKEHKNMFMDNNTFYYG